MAFTVARCCAQSIRRLVDGGPDRIRTCPSHQRAPFNATHHPKINRLAGATWRLLVQLAEKSGLNLGLSRALIGRSRRRYLAQPRSSGPLAMLVLAGLITAVGMVILLGAIWLDRIS